MAVKVKVSNDNTEFEVEEGEKLLSHLKESSSLLFGCEQGYCGTCVCTVAKGAEHLDSKSPDEAEILDGMNAHPGQRLGCRLRVKRGKMEGEVVIEY